MRWWPPALAFLLQRSLLALVAIASGFNPWAASTWVRWDSAHYLEIAARGYTPLYHCPPGSGYPAVAWCGTAGWFPGYPLLVRLLGGSAGAAVLLSAACQLACLVVIWHLLERHQWPALLLAAFFPGNVYLAAVFPVALVSLAILACLALCLSGRFGGAALAAFVAAVCYPTGVLLLPVVLAWALLQRCSRALLVPLGSLLGYGAVLLLLQRQAGRTDAYFLVQAKYGYHLSLPFDALFARLKPIVNARYRTSLTLTTALQTLLSTAMVWIALVRRTSGRETLVLLCVAAFWLAPLVLGGNLSLYRAEALLLPVVLLVPAFPRPLQLLLAGWAVALSAPMASFFLRGALV